MRKTLTAILLTALVAACSGAAPSPSSIGRHQRHRPIRPQIRRKIRPRAPEPDTSPSPSPEPATAFYLRAWYTQALPPQFTFNWLPLVTIDNGVASEGLTVEKLLETNPNSWGETDLKDQEAQFDEGKDLKGPVTLAVAITKTLPDNKKTRLVIYGDSDFASNAYYAQAGNGNLFTNTLNWLARDESFISIKPKTSDDRRIELTEAQGKLINYVIVALLPLGLLITGISVWMGRRK